MTDESFKYTLDHEGGEKEVKIGSLKDLYFLLTSRIDIEVFHLEKKIDCLHKFYTSATVAILVITVIFLATYAFILGRALGEM